MKPIPVGAVFSIPEVQVTWLDGSEVRFRDPVMLGNALFQVYEHPLSEEIQPEGWARHGYLRQVWHVQLDGDETFQFQFEIGSSWRWREIGGPEILGTPQTYMPGISRLEHPVIILPGDHGADLGSHLIQIPVQPFIGWVHLIHYPWGVNAHDDYVALSLRHADGVVAKGVLTMVQSTADGDFQRVLFEREGGYSEFGRGDHVGAAVENGFDY